MKIDACSFHNNKVSLFVQVLLNKDIKKQKVSMRLIERDSNNKQVQAHEFFLDLDDAHVVFGDYRGSDYILTKFEQFKNSGLGKRGIWIESVPGEPGYRVSITTTVKGSVTPNLWITLSIMEMRTLANKVWWIISTYRVFQIAKPFVPHLLGRE